MTSPLTLFDKLWMQHEILQHDGESLLWVDRHYVHEGSFHAFSRLAERGATVAEPELTFGVADHYVPTRGRDQPIANPEIARMVSQLENNTAAQDITLFGLKDPRQGIVHVVGPELGLTLPGLLIVCGDSHTSTHGAFGAFAFGIGASEVAHVLMTQTLWQKKPKRMRITADGKLAEGVGAKDLALAIIAKIGADGATGPRHRICRLRDPRALHGSPDDPVQHGDRGRRPLRHHRPRCNDIRIPAGAASLRRRAMRSKRRWKTGSG